MPPVLRSPEGLLIGRAGGTGEIRVQGRPLPLESDPGFVSPGKAVYVGLRTDPSELLVFFGPFGGFSPRAPGAPASAGSRFGLKSALGDVGIRGVLTTRADSTAPIPGERATEAAFKACLEPRRSSAAGEVGAVSGARLTSVASPPDLAFLPG